MDYAGWLVVYAMDLSHTLSEGTLSVLTMFCVLLPHSNCFNMNHVILELLLIEHKLLIWHNLLRDRFYTQLKYCCI